MSKIRLFAVWVLFAGMGMAVWGETVSVAVDITNTADPTLLGAPIYEIDTLIFTKNFVPLATFTFLPISIAPGETKAFGPYSLTEEPNDLRVMGVKGPPGPYRTKFTADFPRLVPCMPSSHPQEKLKVHLKVVLPVTVTPVPPPEVAAARSLDDGGILISSGINEAITRYAHILRDTKINTAAAAWWGSGDKMLVIVPAAEITIEPGGIVGLLGIKDPPEMITGFYVMRLGTRIPFEPDLELVDLKGAVIKRLPLKLPPELMLTPRNRIPSVGAHICTWQEEPGGKLMLEICIGYHRANCDCIGIYIEL